MVDHRSLFPPVKNQGPRGTCVAFAATAAHEALWSDAVDLSEEFLFWASKQRDGHPDADGTTLAAAATALTNLGQPPESAWGYDPARDHRGATYQPPGDAVEAAKLRRISGGARLAPGVDELQSVLTAGEVPLVVVELYVTWHHAGPGGRIAMPAPGATMLGAHAVLIVGFEGHPSDPDGYFVTRNSWGDRWGDAGYGYLPYDYVRAHGRSAWLLAK